MGVRRVESVCQVRKGGNPFAGCRRVGLLAALVCHFLVAHSAHGLDPSRQIWQYAHTAWRTEDGEYGGTPSVIAQTTDGYIWIGTNLGLVRFDGTRFLPWNPPSGEKLLDSRILSLAGGAEGSLWIGTAFSTAHYKDETLANYREERGRIEGVVSDPGGGAWIVRTQITDGKGPLCRIKAGSYRCFGHTDGVPFESATNIAIDHEGYIWIGGYYGLCRWKEGSSKAYFLRKDQSEEGIGSIKALAAAPDGSVWTTIETSDHVLRLEQFRNGEWITHFYPEISADNADVMTLFVDRNNDVWLGTAHHGIFRIRGARVENFNNPDGLSSDAIGEIFEDREGTIWVVTSDGVDNFRDLPVARYSMREGLYADGPSSLFAGHDGTIWVGNFQSLTSMRDGKLSSIVEGHGLPGRNVIDIFEDHAGLLWVAIDSGLWVYDGTRFHPILHADGTPLGNTFSICEDADHSIWTRSGSHLDHIRDFKVLEETSSEQIRMSFIIASHPAGGIVLGLTNGDLVRYKDGQTQTFAAPEARALGQVRDLLVKPDGTIWGTTQEEYFELRNGKREKLTARNGLSCGFVFALTPGPEESLWLNTACGLVHISKPELDRWRKNPDAVLDMAVVGPLDGVQPGLTPLKPQMVMGRDGKLWFVNARLLEMFDPNDHRRNEIPPPVEVEQVIADRVTYSPRQGLRLPARSRDLEIDYAALSYVAPGKVRYRYILEPRDHEWHEHETRNRAIYSNLPPGRYTFRVAACNNDGVWNNAGASLSFRVSPAYYQTVWFRIWCVVLAALTLWLIYRLRMWSMRENLHARFDERMAERTRLARELHDTLLQTIQGSKMVADDALENPDDAEGMRRALERVSGWLYKATEEGRAALNSLRTSTTQENDLAQALERAARECSMKSSMQYSLQIEGVAQPIHPIVRDEVYRIAYEAIRNACTHSEGKNLEVELRYERDLALRIRDDGRGIHPEIAAGGRPGHFGLKGMHERASRVGGSLTLSSSAYAGTEVELIIPGRVVYAQRDNMRGGWLARLRAWLGRHGEL